ncbi:Major facilitator superfamily MFS_1 OS=Tsukamurella paurometabola (strain ATCC 8368 / DSM /CCUG 35730 / CIP 100753 / JCM 10117 / KCTC 9821 / NBRC 16120/ NCIMB 702349 / NCTC 13040) OX=521096 GN=Tpau_1514 PE=4 SV=1 [Tsukamurella paurometabola]|uniref:Major facilitator superfamily MFS_1 n=1 Tax=Tsukamurella paurometabola (strain ATCC 8368 / DSM 20162 / CCUG 35730 / CIP 100753 / JCM 10117 / KCTC 9821 / NBRC 16120 / NCIMB 702349 / NCTC 13040) TaxID=521096 RepID=D5UXP6_TSUPD|nr:MFS transporter [Tsukamurella paurometabola]ADG78138.1 major facilitator superfamily MFS_1 [Tsukamurella paurometabola DSM 20162]SUP30361.1 Purine efflux pump PbuE [Tsukamurella paurometabola]
MTQGTTPWGTFGVLYLVFFLMGAEMNLVAPLLPDIARAFDSSTGAAGNVVTAYVLCYAITGPLFGRLSDRLARSRAIAAGMAVFATADVLSYVAPSLGLLIAARALSGLGAALGAPSIWAYLAEHAAPAQRGRAVSLGAAAYAGGQVLGVPLGALLATALGWRAPYLLIGVPMLAVAAVMAWRLPSAPATEQGPAPGGLFAPWRDRRIALAFSSSVLLQAGRLGAYTYVGVLLSQRFGYGLTMLGLVGLVVGIGSMCGSVGTGVVVDRLAQRGVHPAWVPACAALVVAVGIAVATTATAPAVVIAAVAVWCAGGGAFFSAQQTYLSSADPDHRASVLGWNNACTNAGVAAGTSVLGALVVGSAWFAAVGAGFALAAALLCVASVRLGPAPARN